MIIGRGTSISSPPGSVTFLYRFDLTKPPALFSSFLRQVALIKIQFYPRHPRFSPPPLILDIGGDEIVNQTVYLLDHLYISCLQEMLLDQGRWTDVIRGSGTRDLLRNLPTFLTSLDNVTRNSEEARAMNRRWKKKLPQKSERRTF